MPAKVILNPYSNRWKAKKRWPQAEKALADAGIDFQLAISEHLGHAVDLAEEAVLEGFSPLIAAGGDGTVGDVVNGMARVGDRQHLGTIGIMPLGTANDLVCNLGLPLGLEEAARVIAGGKTRTLDICRAGSKYFINNSALGLEPYISAIQHRITFLKGIPRYLFATIKGILQNPSWQGIVEWDDGRFEGPLCLVSVGNAPRTGGLFYMTPHADPADGRLTAVIAEKKSIPALLALLPKTMKPGDQFVNSRGVKEIHSTMIKVQLENPSPAHADGDLFPMEVTELDYEILPGRIDILIL